MNKTYILKEVCSFISNNNLVQIPKGTKIVVEEENKSNDSFQWTDELVVEFASFTSISQPIEKSDVEEFKRKHTPKPQADNKPDWEIVAYNHIKTGGISNVGSLHKDDPVEIHSVKRLSDGEVFSVGDEVGYYDCVEPINNFYINEYDKKMWAKCYRDKIRGTVFDCPLSELIKQPQPQKEEQVVKNIPIKEFANHAPKYSQVEVDAMCEDAWKAARQKIGIPRNPTEPPPFNKYETFQDYQNSKK